MWVRSGLVLLTASGTLGCTGEGASPAGGVDAGADGSSADASLGPPFAVTAFDRARIGSDPSGPNFQRAAAAVDLGAGPFERVTLTVQLDTTCYPFESWQANPPPAGQNWPADCDAFDRNFEIVLDEPADGAPGPPGIELERAITPFGGPMTLTIDVTDVANAKPGVRELAVRIPTWSDGAGQVSGSNGGWFVSASFDVVPGGAPRSVLAVVPLFYGSQTTHEGVGPLAFELPAGTTSARIDYRATGHGGVLGGSGCVGPAEEFCVRNHSLFVDDVLAADFAAWRDDCDELCTLTHQGPVGGGFDYCLENPCGAIQSVRASRANWCPGSVTPPAGVTVPAASGSRTFRWSLSDFAQGGSWRVSAVLVAYGG
ncbi:MAG: hypothetical protein KF718_06450 [Polyangiaceae bacterium]|nr:hypothetical protein [Polyangiaceae bacterium]